jgi:hypothetical protein
LRSPKWKLNDAPVWPIHPQKHESGDLCGYDPSIKKPKQSALSPFRIRSGNSELKAEATAEPPTAAAIDLILIWLQLYTDFQALSRKKRYELHHSGSTG